MHHQERHGAIAKRAAERMTLAATCAGWLDGYTRRQRMGGLQGEVRPGRDEARGSGGRRPCGREFRRAQGRPSS